MLKRLFTLFKPAKAKNQISSTAVTQDHPPIETPPPSPLPTDTIPDITDPIWRLLIDQQKTLETKNYALQMLLAWAWKAPQSGYSEEQVSNKIKIVHLFFKKNQHSLQNEIQQLSGYEV